MIKHQGLAHLADVANPVHYPVRRRGEARRLVPNWVGIAWLEAEALEDTEILATEQPSPTQAAVKMGEGLAVQRSRRAVEMVDESVRERPLYVRPMFQVFNDAHENVMLHHGARVRQDSACADCYDFQYPGRDCPRHPAKRLARNHLNEAVYWESRPPGPTHTCAVAGRGDCAACADQVRPVTAYYSAAEITEASVHAIDEQRIQEDLPREPSPWQNLVATYARITEAEAPRGIREPEGDQVEVESVDQEGRPLRVTWHIERNTDRRRPRGYYTER